jgi:hypothetical protein
MNDLTPNTISAVSIDSIELAKNTMFKGDYFSGISSFDQDEMGSISFGKSEGQTSIFYHTSFSVEERKWNSINHFYAKPYWGTISTNEAEKNQQTNSEVNLDLRNKIIELQEDIGSDLFNQLSYNHILLLINTAGVINFGPININDVYKSIEG